MVVLHLPIVLLEDLHTLHKTAILIHSFIGVHNLSERPSIHEQEL